MRPREFSTGGIMMFQLETQKLLIVDEFHKKKRNDETSKSVYVLETFFFFFFPHSINPNRRPPVGSGPPGESDCLKG